MSTIKESMPVPLRQDASGAIRIGTTRVLLELVIHAFEEGATPEAITQRYESLGLPDVYAEIAYYLANPKEVADYLERREQQASVVREKLSEHTGDLQLIRQRILSRHQDGEVCDAPLAD